MARLGAQPAVVAPEGTGGEDSQRPPRHLLRRRLLVVGVILLAVVAAFAVRAWERSGPAPITRGDVEQSIQRGIDAERKAERAAPSDAAAAHQLIRPSLVQITTESVDAAGREIGSGAGVVINANGMVLTALHVVAGAKKITTRFADGTEAVSRIANRQPASDIAVLTVDRLPEVVVPAVLGGGARVGDPVFAVGHPLGLADSLTAGVVSALGRSVRLEVGGTLGDLIQFDAAVNPGNSGGPLLNRGGQVIGIVTGLANPSRQAFFVGIGFAVPIATAGGVAGSPPQ